MDVHSLITKFAKLGHVTIGSGPKNPDFTNAELQKEIDDFLLKYPFLRKDKDYIDFLEYYSGAMLDWPNGTLVNIFGFLEDVSLHFTQDVGSIVCEEGYLPFCELIIVTQQKEFAKGYSFDATGTKHWGVYQFTEEEGYTWYCENFLECLNSIINSLSVK